MKLPWLFLVHVRTTTVIGRRWSGAGMWTVLIYLWHLSSPHLQWTSLGRTDQFCRALSCSSTISAIHMYCSRAFRPLLFHNHPSNYSILLCRPTRSYWIRVVKARFGTTLLLSLFRASKLSFCLLAQRHHLQSFVNLRSFPLAWVKSRNSSATTVINLAC